MKQGLLIVAGFAAGIAADKALFRHFRVTVKLKQQKNSVVVLTVRMSRISKRSARRSNKAATSRTEVTMATREDRIKELQRDWTRDTLGAVLASFRNESALDAVQYGKLDEEYLATKVAEAENNDHLGRTVEQIVKALQNKRDSETPVVEDEHTSWIRQRHPETGDVIGRKPLPRVDAEPVVKNPPPKAEIVDESDSSWKHPFGIGRKGRKIGRGQ